MEANNNPQDEGSYISPKDGAEDLIREEKKYLYNRNKKDSNQLVGLAISGGGIRSAIFSLGVMQRLAKKGWMEEIDYLSTVSGGGYIGSSLTWFLRYKPSNKDNGVKFGVTADNFPFGTQCLGKENPITKKPEEGGDRYKAKLLQALRQNGKYLAPGNGITILSLLGIFLRGIVLSIVVYFPLLVLFFIALYSSSIVAPISSQNYGPVMMYLTTLYLPGSGASVHFNPAIAAAIWLIFISIGGSIYYSIKTHSSHDNSKDTYDLRRFNDRWAGRIIIIITILIALGILPLLHDLIIFKKGAGLDKAALLGSTSIVLGFITSILTYLKSGSVNKKSAKVQQASKKNRTLMFLTGLASFLLIYGIMFLSYSIVYELMEPPVESGGYWMLGILIGTSVFIGRFVNLNYVSVHRYYRDRLMETFMPNVNEVIENGHTDPKGATDADRLWLSDICKVDDAGPYHIINTNIVLVESPNKKYRGRGGDNFILSPLYCGSSATGWVKTVDFMNNNMTLPTAMAISGAAANPDTGVGGEGPTRNRGLSLLMSLLNIRLGYWAPHPDPDIRKKNKTNSSVKKPLENIGPLKEIEPNFFHPMLTSTMFGTFIGSVTRKIKNIFLKSNINYSWSYLGKTENSHFVELTDGGHFENLGLYELIRRKLKIIIVCDGGADPDFEFTDIANVIEKVLVDFGVTIEIDVSPLIPSRKIDPNTGLRCAERGYVTGKINYPDNTQGELIYTKTTFIKGAYPDLICYKNKNPLFPDQPTADQFFDEKQFEAYRGLGNFIGKQLTSSYVLTNKGTLKEVVNKRA